MSYSEEEIQKYLNILQNVNDGLNIISPVKDENIPPKIPEKVSCENSMLFSPKMYLQERISLSK